MNNSVFGLTSGNVSKHGDIRLAATLLTTYLVLERICHITKSFSEFVSAIEMNTMKVKMNKPIYLGLSILGINKTVMFEFLYDNITGGINCNHK